MRILFIHADKFEYTLQSATKFAERIPQEDLKWSDTDVLVAFTNVESEDLKYKSEIIDNACNEIDDVLKTLSAKKLVLYPYAHLSEDSAHPAGAGNLMIELEQKLKHLFKDINLHRAPFGYYKKFELICKGHPMAELSRTVKLKKVPVREEIVAHIESEYYILTPQGVEIPVKLEKNEIEKLDILKSEKPLKDYIYSEELGFVEKIDEIDKKIPSMKVLQKLELVDYEGASDTGHFRFYPNGTLIFNLLKDWAEYIATERLNAMEIETPIIYDYNEPDIRAQVESFRQRHYVVSAADERKDFVLRFAGDFGLFKIMSSAKLSYKNLPLRIYEFSKSFRYEQSGELAGLRRLRAFHMPDVHSFTKDLTESWSEFQTLYKNYTDLANATGIEYAVVFRIVKEYYGKFKSDLINLVKYTAKPAFVEVLSSPKHYWVVKHEFQGIDSKGINFQLATVQLDVEDAERYGIKYVAHDGSKKGCFICHSSIGSVERWIYGIFEEALKMEKPMLPLWLAPTQLRLIPVDKQYIEDCIQIVKRINARIDIDDRDETVSKKVMLAEKNWINYIVVYGEKERRTGILPVRDRTGKIENMKITDLNTMFEKLCAHYPFRKLALPVLLSKRIQFRG